MRLEPEGLERDGKADGKASRVEKASPEHLRTRNDLRIGAPSTEASWKLPVLQYHIVSGVCTWAVGGSSRGGLTFFLSFCSSSIEMSPFFSGSGAAVFSLLFIRSFICTRRADAVKDKLEKADEGC
jgi:hypothetical protein